MSQPEPFKVNSSEVSHAVIEVFGGDNNLSHFVLEDLQEMASGMQGSFSVLALTDFANKGAIVVEQPPENAESWGRQAIKAFEHGYRELFSAHPTLGAFHSSHNITENFNTLIKQCDDNGKEGFDWLREARDNAQAFANHDTYDIKDFAINLKDIASDDDVQDACDQIIIAFDEARRARDCPGGRS